MNVNLLKGLALCAVTLFATSCVKEFEGTNNQETNLENIKIASNFVTTASYTVPVADGYTTEVSYNGLLLAQTSTPITINVPKAAVKGRAGEEGLNIKYVQGVKDQPFTNLWQTILFEDSKKGDYDYNDIVIHANYKTVGSKLTVDVQPIALGSTKDIKLGFSWVKGSASGEVTVAESCRRDMFAGKEGFVNTRKYDRHYALNENMEQIEVETGDVTNNLMISWFIVVDNNVRIYAVNQNHYQCIDVSGRPYGLALTDTGLGNEQTTASYSPSASTLSAWDALMPDLEWAKMPAQPSVPSDCDDIMNTNTWSQSPRDFIAAAGQTYDNVALNMGNVKNIYINGTVTVNNAWSGNNTKTIYVMPGGTLNVDVSSIQYFNIVNYGTLNFVKSSVDIRNNVSILTNGNLDLSNQTIQFGEGSKVSANGDIVVKSIGADGAFNIYSKGLAVEGDLKMSHKGYVYVDGGVSANNLELNNGMKLYCQCSLNVANNLYLTNSSNLYVKGSVTAADFKIDVSGTCYLMSGSFANISNRLTADNAASIVTVGDAMSVVKADVVSLTGGTLRFDLLFPGLTAAVYNTLYEGNYLITNESDSRIVWGETKHNSDDITAPVIEGCSPGYNPVTPVDNGGCWFSYPLEQVDISTCYDFDKWTVGDYDFTPLSGAKIFDINATNPTEGDQKEIFNVK